MLLPNSRQHVCFATRKQLQIREGIKVIVFLYLHGNVFGYSLEVLHKALLMSTHNVRYYGQNERKYQQYFNGKSALSGSGALQKIQSSR